MGMICRKAMTRCLTPGMCSPHGGCQEMQFKPDWDRLEAAKESLREHMEIIRQLKTENESLRKDAERYRFFRDSQQVSDNGDGWSVMYLDNGAGGFGGGVCQADFTDLDEAADFAMSKQR